MEEYWMDGWRKREIRQDQIMSIWLPSPNLGRSTCQPFIGGLGKIFELADKIFVSFVVLKGRFSSNTPFWWLPFTRNNQMKRLLSPFVHRPISRMHLEKLLLVVAPFIILKVQELKLLTFLFVPMQRDLLT